MKTPFSLLIDDGAPIDPMFFESPGYKTPLLVPTAFTRRLASLFERYEMAGKFTVIPMPSCLGRVDQSLKLVPARHLAAFLDIVRTRIAPRFDITPEFITHKEAYDLKGNRFLHVYEDQWLSRASLEDATDYFELAFRILKNVGLRATGMTSPWMSGEDVESKYAHAIADAQWRVFRRKLTWYFVHMSFWKTPIACSTTYRNESRGQRVISVPTNCTDIFWTMNLPVSKRRSVMRDNIERLISSDGRTGRIRDLMESGHPVTFVTHWQSLFTQGSGLGLEGLEVLAERIRRVFGSTIEWLPCSELARRSER